MTSGSELICLPRLICSRSNVKLDHVLYIIPYGILHNILGSFYMIFVIAYCIACCIYYTAQYCLKQVDYTRNKQYNMFYIISCIV
jgi:hypothetical protein